VERRRVPPETRPPVNHQPSPPREVVISRAERYVSPVTVEHWTRSYCVGPRTQFSEAP
jgi:hypothetical protein